MTIMMESVARHRTGAVNRSLHPYLVSKKQRRITGNGSGFLKLQSPLLVTHLLQQDHTPNLSITRAQTLKYKLSKIVPHSSHHICILIEIIFVFYMHGVTCVCVHMCTYIYIHF